MTNGKEYAGYLNTIVTAIQKNRNLKAFDPTNINTLAQQCRSFPKRSQDWYYDFKIEFPRESFKTMGLDKVKPEKTVKKFNITLYIKAGGPYVPVKANNLTETITCLELDLIAMGYGTDEEIEEKQGADVICAWHLDIHPDGQESDFAHPRFHWQYGGKYVWDNTKEWFGNHLLLIPPRLAHPPLDAILAIDFVLSNYYAPAWKDLRNDPSYSRTVATAQRLYWEPYYRAVASGDWSANNRLPFLYWPKT